MPDVDSVAMEPVNLCFLGGLGDGADAWSGVLNQLPPHWRVTALSLSDLCPPELFSLDSAVNSLEAHLGEASRQTHLVGLSAGAMVALRYGAKHEVASLFLSAPQVQPPKTLIAIQNAVFRLLPAPIFQSSGISKRGVMCVAHALAGEDLVADAKRIAVSTTIVCGSKDRANLQAARLTHQLISGSQLAFVDGAKHEWHKQLPKQFSYKLRRHLATV